MTTYTITSDNASTAISMLTDQKNYYYFIIEATVTFENKQYTIGAGSVLDFRGGVFSGSSSANINLNGAQVIAGAYTIFNRVTVTGFTNAVVKAEWFVPILLMIGEDYGAFISRAITAANGCPVELENKTYNITTPITFISKESGTPSRQTLICPGTLQVGDNAAVIINANGIDLKINRIVGTEADDSSTGDNYLGQGICVGYASAHSNIEVNEMTNLNRGISIEPSYKFSYQSEADSTSNGGVQYCKFNFNVINADYCFYIDIYSKSNLVNKGSGILTWFNENQIVGGVMSGRYGVYIVSPGDVLEYDDDYYHKNEAYGKNGLIFRGISFSNISVLPLRLRFMERCKFLNINMFSGLPGTTSPLDPNAPWIDLDYVNNVEFTFCSYIYPSHINAVSNCDNIYFKGDVVYDEDWHRSRFDIVGINELYDKEDENHPQLYATSSIVPYNIGATVSVLAFQTLIVNIADVLPHMVSYPDGENGTDLAILPSDLNVVIGNGGTFVLNITSLYKFAQCIFTVNVTVNMAGTVKFQSENGVKIKDYTSASDGVYTKVFTSGGVYKIQMVAADSFEIIQVIKKVNYDTIG